VLEVDDVDAEYAYVVSTGWPRDAELVVRPWGLRDFRLLDPAGHLLRVTDRQPG
jgi:lactoylglutathione lyase